MKIKNPFRRSKNNGVALDTDIHSAEQVATPTLDVADEYIQIHHDKRPLAALMDEHNDKVIIGRGVDEMVYLILPADALMTLFFLLTSHGKAICNIVNQIGALVMLITKTTEATHPATATHVLATMTAKGLVEGGHGPLDFGDNFGPVDPDKTTVEDRFIGIITPGEYVEIVSSVKDMYDVMPDGVGADLASAVTMLHDALSAGMDTFITPAEAMSALADPKVSGFDSVN